MAGQARAEPQRAVKTAAFNSRILCSAPSLRARRLGTPGALARHLDAMHTTLIGRSHQLAAAERLLDAAASAQPAPHTLIVSGEAGIGKSRLVAALRERAGPGWKVLESACFEPYRDAPFAPIVDLLSRRYAGPVAGWLAAALDAAPEVQALLPGLARPAAPAPASAPADAAAQNQRHLLAGLSALFARLAADGPLLLCIEDLHWSDAATLQFLPILAHTLADLPALLVLTYRTDEVDAPLGAMLSALDRRRLAKEIGLSRLSRGEVAELLARTRGAPVAPPLLDTLYKLTEGNPFFVEEVAMALPATLADEGDPLAVPIPRSVQETVRQRSARLSPSARQLLTLAAALGRGFSFAVLQHVTGRDEALLVEDLKELIGAHLIVEEGADAFAFRHALACAAIYGGLLARERRALHRQLGEALESLLGEAHAADLARHFLLAERWEQALHYARIAAGQAWRVYALREVIAHQSVALRAAAHLPDVPQSPLLVERATTHGILGNFEAAHADLVAARADAQRRAHAEDEWRALIGLGELWMARDYGRAGEFFMQALEYARRSEEPPLLALSLHRVGVWHLNEDRPHTAYAMHQEALALYTELADAHGQAESLERLGVARIFQGDSAGGVRHLAQAEAIFLGLDNQVDLDRIRALPTLRANAFCEALDGETLPTVEAQQLRLLEVMRAQELWAQVSPFLHSLASQLLLVGDYGQAEAYLRESIAISEELGYPEWLAYALGWRAALALELHEPREAVAWGERALAAARRVCAPLAIRLVAYYLMQAYTATGALPEAGALLEAVAPDRERAEPSLLLRRLRLAGAELALAQGAPQRALAEVDSLIASAVNPEGKVIPVLWHARGAALLALGRLAEARHCLGQALAAARAEGRRPLALRLLAAQVALAARQHRREEAAAAIEQAWALIDELAATIPDAAPREGFRQRARAALPAPPPVTPRQAVKQVFDGLTDREVEVARLIARGQTNRQIAEALVLSERTVGAHVGNILAKLGFTSRLQVARWAIEKGIA